MRSQVFASMLALSLAACSSDSAPQNERAAQTSEASAAPYSDTSADVEVIKSGWARQIAAICVGEAGEENAARCDCVAGRLTEGRSAAEISQITDEERQTAWQACG